MNDHQGCANALWRAWQNIERLLAENEALRRELEAAKQEKVPEPLHVVPPVEEKET